MRIRVLLAALTTMWMAGTLRAEEPTVAETGASAVVDEGALLEACGALLVSTLEPARVAIVVVDALEVRRTAIERSLVRVMRDRGREDIVTPALVRARLGDAAERLQAGGSAATGLGADHVIIADVVNEGSTAVLSLRLIRSESGEVLATQRVPLLATGSASSARAQDVRVAAADLADLVAEAVERSGAAPRSHRIAVPPITAVGAAAAARLDRFVQAELLTALRERGFLVVERAQLQSAMDQLALQQLTDGDNVGAVGKAVGAQSLALVQLTEAADTFLVSVRVVAVDTGVVLGAARATMKRDNVVSLAAVETRTASEAAIRSALAPGWGQAYNGDATKAVVFGVGTYSALLTTVALGVGAGVTWLGYLGVKPGDGVSAAQAAQRAVALRQQTDALLTGTAVAGAVTAALWSLGIADALVSTEHER
jgi:TolB-like protein